MVQYEIIQDFSWDHLSLTISGRLNAGWRLAGGVSAVSIKYDSGAEEFTDDGKPTIFYVQAVTKGYERL